MFHISKATAVFKLLGWFSLLGLGLIPISVTAQTSAAPTTAQTSAPTAWPPGYKWLCAQGSRCYIGPYVVDIAFGTAGKFTKQAAMSDTFWCGEDTFSGANPLPGVDKSCWIASTTVRTGIKDMCANEGGTCNISAKGTPVMYGVKGYYFFANKDASFACNKAAFTNKEFPSALRSIPKSCFYGAPVGGVN